MESAPIASIPPPVGRASPAGYAALGFRLDAARARLELACVLIATGQPDASDVAGRAFSELESLGAAREADAAAALLRGLGVKTKSGRRAAGLLCPHWGYVVKGKLTFTFADGHAETYEAGDAYYAPPGHTPHLYTGSEVVEFHPTTELAQTMEVVEKNMEAMGA